MMDFQNDNSLQHTHATFKALVDAVVPRTPVLAEEYGQIQLYGAIDSRVNEYMIASLDNYYYISMAKRVAELLDVAAEQLTFINRNNKPLDDSMFPEGGTFAALAPSDRILALNLLEQLNDTSDLPVPFQDGPGILHTILSILNRFITMGYYSEWSVSTHPEPSNQPKIEYFPLGWKQAGYPGPSLGYRTVAANFK